METYSSAMQETAKIHQLTYQARQPALVAVLADGLGEFDRLGCKAFSTAFAIPIFRRSVK